MQFGAKPNMTDQAIRVALLGYGYAGKTFHAPLIESVPGLELVLVCSGHQEKVHADLPKMTVIGDVNKAATHPEIDLVVIATPNETHALLAEAALQAGKHVVVDKPFTLTVKEAQRLAELAEQKGQLLSVFHNRRWDSDFLGAKAVKESGALGEIVYWESRMDRFRPQVRDRWRERAGPGAGLWYDLGPHLIDQTIQLFGMPQKVSASFAKQRAGSQTEDWIHVLLHCGKTEVVLHASLLAAGKTPRFVMHGTEGSWIKYGTDVQETLLKQGIRPSSEGWGQDPEPSMLYRADGTLVRLPVPAGNYAEYYRGIRDAIYGKQPNPVTPREAVALMSVLETTIQSASQGCTLPIMTSSQEPSAWE